MEFRWNRLDYPVLKGRPKLGLTFVIYWRVELYFISAMVQKSVIAVPSAFFLLHVTITHSNIENMSPLKMWASCLYIKLVTQERLKLVFIRSEISILHP